MKSRVVLNLLRIIEFFVQKPCLITTQIKCLKVAFTTFLLVCFLNLKKSTCETKKNDFYFTSKALFIVKKIKF